MLSEIHIQNFALIDRLSVKLGPGLNVLTGETGAGKSIIIDAIGAILGERAEADQVRSGTERASVDACFRLEGQPVDDEVVPVEDGLLVISREINRTGRSQARINGRPATLGMVRDVARGVVDIHGQHEHQSLLSVERHVRILDHWVGDAASSLLQQIRAKHRAWTELRRERDRLLTDERARSRQMDLLCFQVDEIDAAKLAPGEEEQLQADRLRLASAEKLAAAAAEAASLLSDDETSAIANLSVAAARLREVVRIDPSLARILEAAEGALYQLEDAARELEAYREGIEFNPHRLNQVEERLDLLRTLKRKYGDTIEEILAYRDRAEAELLEIECSEERAQQLEADLRAAEEELAALCSEMSALRHRNAAPFAAAVMHQLADLGMEKTSFKVDIRPAPMGPDGADAVEFLLSANPGEPLKPLARVASGGEMSRIMLALKTVMAQTDRIPVMIFDEIDVGVGGATGTVLAHKLRALAQTSQVLCVTHLPQIAAAADGHYSVRKEEADGRTHVVVERLGEQERLGELARMLGGAQSAAAMEHAREMRASFSRCSHAPSGPQRTVTAGAGQ